MRECNRRSMREMRQAVVSLLGTGEIRRTSNEQAIGQSHDGVLGSSLSSGPHRWLFKTETRPMDSIGART